MPKCALCPALCESRAQIVMPTPAPCGGLLAIGEAPGQAEDENGYGFAGQAGKTLDGLLAEHGIPREGYGQANVLPAWHRKAPNGEQWCDIGRRQVALAMELLEVSCG